MSRRLVLTTALGTAALIALGRLGPVHGREVLVGDLVVADLLGSVTYGTVDGVSSYAIGTVCCNQGDFPLAWLTSGSSADRHPVIAQNLFRHREGRFEQIGMSWVKHGFCAFDQEVCGPCAPIDGCDWLGVGCSDTYGAQVNGHQVRLGPRWEVNASTAEFVLPYSHPTGNNVVRGRLQVHYDDLDPQLNPGAAYIAEGQYLHPDDVVFTPHNNSAWRPMEVGGILNGAWQILFNSDEPTRVEQPAILAWAQLDPGVDIVEVDAPDGGRFLVGSRCTDNGDGTWHYEYAVLNMNSHRAAGRFDVPRPASVDVTSLGFHDVDYHSGDGPDGVNTDGTDWTATVTGSAVTWSTDAFEVNEHANALRWSTLYNFRFDADLPPGTVTATLGLFRPGTPEALSVQVCGPVSSVLGDLDGDGLVGASDLQILITAWGACPPAGACTGDLDGSGAVGVPDLLLLLAAWS